jgi:hypothetical protein
MRPTRGRSAGAQRRPTAPPKGSLGARLPVLAAKMANTNDQNKELQATYLPHQVAVVRLADASRVQGRSRLRENKSRPKS